MGALLAGPPAPPDHPRPKTRKILKKYHVSIKNVGFLLEKCVFASKRDVSDYVLRRKRVIFKKSDHFELEICVKARGGRLALQNGRPLSLKC